MKLTLEQLTAINLALADMSAADGLTRRDAIFSVGYRFGYEAALEAAAKACESEAAKCRGTEDDIGERIALDCVADDIRAIPLPE